jgi:hypothetical protein
MSHFPIMLFSFRLRPIGCQFLLRIQHGGHVSPFSCHSTECDLYPPSQDRTATLRICNMHQTINVHTDNEIYYTIVMRYKQRNSKNVNPPTAMKFAYIIKLYSAFVEYTLRLPAVQSYSRACGWTAFARLRRVQPLIRTYAALFPALFNNFLFTIFVYINSHRH